MTTSAPLVPAQAGRHQRSIKNYLIDSRFQLKYTGFIVLMALVISAGLGTLLGVTSQQLAVESQEALKESHNVSDMMAMSEVMLAGDSPELVAVATAKSKERDEALRRKGEALVARQHLTMSVVVGALVALVILIGVLGIYFTHKVAGPIYKMKMLLRQVGEGRLKFYGRLRKGDELQDFFEAFQDMVEQLRQRQGEEIAVVERLLESAKRGSESAELVEKLTTLRDGMKAALET